MKMKFEEPHKYSIVNVKIIEDVIGPGRQREKSASLKRFHPLFDENKKGFGTLPQVAITPEFFRSYLKRIGASHEDPCNAQKAIDCSGFSKHEKDAIQSALEPFRGLYVAIRSDESVPEGIGIWHTGFVFVDDSGIEGAIKEIKKILKSDFSRDAFAFKKRMDLPVDEIPGVFIMPVHGCDIALGQVFTSLCQVNAITNFQGRHALLQIGVGIGGANSNWTRTTLLKDLGKRHLSNLTGLMNEVLVLSNGRSFYLSDRSFESEIGKNHLKTMLAIDKPISALKEGFESLDKMVETPLYLELAYNGTDWRVVQCCDIALGQADEPEVRGRKILDVSSNNYLEFGRNVSGRKVVESSTVFHLQSFKDDFSGINEKDDGYVLFSSIPVELFLDRFSFADYSNASALAFFGGNQRSIGSHFKGALRKAGIPVLAGDMDTMFLYSLKTGLNNRNVLVYANDEVQEGFILDRG